MLYSIVKILSRKSPKKRLTAGILRYTENARKKSGTARNLGSRLLQWRKALPLKSFELAKLIRISQGSLSDIENNKSLPSADTIAKLYQHTDLNIIWLLTGRGPIKKT